MKKEAIFFFIFSANMPLIEARKIHRPRNPNMPYVLIWQNDNNKVYKLSDSHLRNIPMHTYDEEYLNNNLIPENICSKYQPETLFSGNKIKNLIEDLLKEIKIINKKTQVAFKEFFILKKIDFNFVTKTGFLVLKFKDYPLILKLFIENAKTISHPLDKGFQERGLFVMGGCIRHFCGFTRLKNAKLTMEKIKGSKWENIITIPRKWFWVPENPLWIYLKTFNLADTPEIIKIPGIYAILCDAINLDYNWPNTSDCLELSSFMEYTIDPHVVNFLKEKDTNKMAIIDTEHFPTLIGATEKIPPASNYVQWYLNMADSYISNTFFYAKCSRIKRQKNRSTYYPI